MNKRSIATVSLSGALDEKLRAIAAAGFDAVEIFENDLLSFSGSPRDVGQMCRDLGLSICAFQPFRDFEGMPEPQRTRNFARAERKFDLMQELQTDLMLICSNISPASLGGIDRAAADFRELGERAAARGLRVGYEALAWGRHVNDYRDAWEIVRRADHKSIGVILDSFHALAPSFPTMPIQSIPADKIFLVQLADAPKLGLDVLSWSRHFRCFPGQGDLPVASFVEAVLATGYAGPLSLEIFNDQFRAGSAVRTATDGLRSLILLEDDVRAAASAAPAMPLQPKAKSRGVGFIEFAVSDEKARDLAALFGQLGFRKTGAHRSKDVERWSQGHIDLVINCEPDGFAHSHFVAHGPMTPAGPWRGRRRCRRGLSTSPLGQANSRFRRSAASAAACCISWRKPARTGTSISSRCAATRRPIGSMPSTISRSRCPMTRCCRGCCSTPAFSIWSACRRSRSRTRLGWCRARR
jgi:3-dehydroshikimate dehydratase